MAPTSQHLKLNNQCKPVLLANDRMTGQTPGILLGCQLRGLLGSNFEHSPTLRKAGPSLIVLFAADPNKVQTLGCGLPIGSCQFNNPLVNLDARNNPILLEYLNKGLPIRGLLVKGFLEEDDPKSGHQGL